MGAVYLVEHVELKTRHAIKVLWPQLSSQPHLVQRFRNEARAAAVTRSPNIVAVRDFGQLDNGSWYLVMDYWRGETLSVYLASRGLLSHRLTIQIAVDALNGLAAAHSRNIIHRDLKPDNLYLARAEDDLRTMILDFGVCRLGEDTGIVTRTGAVLGTPRYMAPEQFRGEAVDHRADLWALGAILYEIATNGWLPYDDDTAPQARVVDDAVLTARMCRPHIDPQQRRPGITRALADAILTLIDPDPAKRPASASKAAQLLAETLPADGDGPSGIELVQARAPELLGPVRDAARTPVLVVARGPAPRYVIRYKIGIGGMAEVFRADALGAEGFVRPVALKRVLAGYSEAPAFATMFCDEARIASHFSHPNVVSVLDFDRDAAGRLFLIMEYVAGRDLGTIVATGRLPPAMAIFIASEILRGLGYAHVLPNPSDGIRSVVHRDVSPHNVLISWEGAVKVSDFGIAKALGARAGAEGVGGKPSYMSPEQVNGEPLDGRSDLFCVGILLWEALTGVRLFKREGVKETFRDISLRDSVPPSAVRTDLPADLDAVVMKLLARDRELRYATAELAIEDLARCADNPRNGRSELVRLLASRFPAEIQARSEGRTASDPITPPREVVRPPVAAVAGTLISASGQWLALPEGRRHRRRMAVGAVTGVIVSMGTFLVILFAHRSLSVADPVTTARRAIVTSSDADAAAGSRPVVQPSAEVGSLAIYVAPFAQVWVDDAHSSAGQTPLHLELHPGRHQIRLANERLRKEITVSVFINATKETVIDETW
jgi:serine/threonine protein kinase